MKLVIFFTLIFIACNDVTSEHKSGTKRIIVEEIHNVEVKVLRKENFFIETLSEGILKSKKKIRLATNISEKIKISELEFEFYLLKSEFKNVRINDTIVIIPFSNDKKYHGYISALDHYANEQGLFRIKARVKDRTNQLIDGMSIKAIVQKPVPQQLVVPKTAVVLRDNLEVIFKLNNGKAYWTYIKSTLENSNSFSIVANIERGSTLNVGDTIIISNNLNLAHMSNVKIN